MRRTWLAPLPVVLLLIACGTPPKPSSPAGTTYQTSGASAPAGYSAPVTTQAAPTTPVAPTAPAPPTTPAGPRTAFTDGTWLVGTDIAAGRYRTTVPETSNNCYWERQRDTNGTFSSIIANGNVHSGIQAIVTIATTDEAFTARGCGTWGRV